MNSKKIFISIFIIFILILFISNNVIACTVYSDWTDAKLELKKPYEIGLRVTDSTFTNQSLTFSTTGLCDKDLHYYGVVFFNSDIQSGNQINSLISEIMYYEDEVEDIVAGRIKERSNRYYCFMDIGSQETNVKNCNGSSIYLTSNIAAGSGISKATAIAMFGRIDGDRTDDLSLTISTEKILSIMKESGINNFDELKNRFNSYAVYVTRYNKGAAIPGNPNCGDNTSSQTGFKHEILTQMGYTKNYYNTCDLKTGAVFAAISPINMVSPIGWLTIFGLNKLVPPVARSNLFLTKNYMLVGPNLEAGYLIKGISGATTSSVSGRTGSQASSIPCDSSFRTATELGYQASWSYKCNEDKTSYHKCDNGVYAGLHEFSPNSRLKPLICTSESTETTESTTTTETSQNKVVLTIENNTNISDINYSIDNANWYSTKNIDFPKSFILGNKTNNKTINVDLDMFTEGTIYAIVSTVDKRTEIDNELKTIYQTGNFTGYNLQTSSNVFEINNTLSLSKLQYTLDNTKKVKLNISSNITNGDLVIIFMQKSQDNSKVNLVYSNLYVLDEKEQSQYYLCEINKKIVSFYCRGHNCNLNISCMKSNRWDFDNGLFVGLTPRAVETATPLPTPTPTPTGPQEVQSPVSSGNCSIDIQTTVEEYITCLRNNIETVDLTTRRYDFVGITAPVVTGNEIINQKYNSIYYSVNNKCYTNTTYNNVIFEAAKNARLTEEEIAQLWGLLATESECNENVTCGDYCTSYGIGQVNNTWNDSYSYNTIKPYLTQINSSKYDTFTKYQAIFNRIKTVSRSYEDQVSSVEISIAINKYHKSLIVNTSKNANRPFTDDLDKIYDHNDAIDLFFANGYIYSGGIGKDFSRVAHFNDGIKIGATRFQGIVYPALRKIGFYLIYKRMIYQCHETVINNAFVTAYKTKYQGSYCK